MTDHEQRQRALETATSGHPLAIARVREMTAVIEAVLVSCRRDTVDNYLAIKDALRSGGWLK